MFAKSAWSSTLRQRAAWISYCRRSRSAARTTRLLFNLPLAQLCENSSAKLIADRKKDLMQPAELKRRIDLINAKAKAAEESIGAVGNAVGYSAGLATGQRLPSEPQRARSA